MKLEENMYVRTKNGEIHKIKSIDDNFLKYENGFGVPLVLGGHIVKASHNIIDLIEVGDYVNGERVIALKKDISERNIHMNSKGNSIFVDYDLSNDWYYGIDDEDIKTIVTKEQFECMKYSLEW